jgi:hypothetical protein
LYRLIFGIADFARAAVKRRQGTNVVRLMHTRKDAARGKAAAAGMTSISIREAVAAHPDNSVRMCCKFWAVLFGPSSEEGRPLFFSNRQNNIPHLTGGIFFPPQETPRFASSLESRSLLP